MEADLVARLEEKERQLERYAADLRETFKAERVRSAELRASYMATVRALANAVEARDAYTGRHAERVAAYGLTIAAAAGLSLSDEPQIEFGFLLHDIGKVAVPDAILFKPGPLTADEYTLITAHPMIGWEILRHIDFLDDAKTVVRHHHERWDGTGYPDGLAGDDIPIEARIVAAVDAYSAMTIERVYRRPMERPEAIAELQRSAGTHLDPAVVQALIGVLERAVGELDRAA